MVAPIIRKAIIAAIFIGGVGSAIAAYHAKKTTDLYEIRMNAEKSKHAAIIDMFESRQSYAESLSKEKAEFEKEIANLVSIAFGDTFHFGFGAERKVDLEARRAFFTNEAWANYMSFIELERDELRQAYEWNYLKRPPKSGKPKEPNTLFYVVDFKPWSQKYSEIGENKIEFFAEGMRSQGYYDVRRYHQQFTLNLVIQGNLKERSKFIIEKWDVNVSKQGGFGRKW